MIPPASAFLSGWILFAGPSIALAQTEAPSPPPPAPAEVATVPAPSAPPDLGFHAALAPYGTWTTLAPFGEVWVPRDMPAGWRPYTTGHWAFTNAVGWTWDADEPWGWAAFHYGRWTLDPTLGWVWIPGDVWGPAWVTWRQCDDFVGWAPLPPSVTWTAGVGLVFGNPEWMLSLGVGWWNFVPVRHFCHPHVCDVLVVRERVPVVLHDSRVVERAIRFENGRAVDRAIPVEVIEKASGEPVKRVALRDIALPPSLRRAPVRPGELALERPRQAPNAPGIRTPARDAETPPVRMAPQGERAPDRTAPAHPRAAHREHHVRQDSRNDRPAKERQR